MPTPRALAPCPGDLIAQLPTARVTYVIDPGRGWSTAPGRLEVSRLLPPTGTLLPSWLSADQENMLALILSGGTPGARYRVQIGEQAWTLAVSWFIPTRPRREGAQVIIPPRERIPAGAVWIARDAFGQGELVEALTGRPWRNG